MAIITFGGEIGAGKSTVAPRIAKELGYESFDMGSMMRELARQQGMTIDDFYKSLEDDPEFDRSVDAMQSTLMKEKDDFVIQARLAFHFAKQSGKPHVNILLQVDPRVSAQRKVDEGGYPGKTVEDVMALHAMREDSERLRYRTLYGVNDHLDPANFDIVCDTTPMDRDQVTAFVLAEIRKRIG